MTGNLGVMAFIWDIRVKVMSIPRSAWLTNNKTDNSAMQAEMQHHLPKDKIDLEI